MEQIIANVIEKSVVAGAFMYLLYYVVHAQNQTLGQISLTLKEICETLVHLETRVSKLEEGK